MRRATISNVRKHWIGQGRSEKEFDAESVEDVGGVGVREGEIPGGRGRARVEALAGGLVEGEADGHRRAPFQESMRLCCRREEGLAGDLLVPARGSAPEGFDLGGGGLLLDLGFGRGFL